MTNPVDPTGQDLKRLLSEDPGGPVVMLNLLKFRAGQRASYARYAREIQLSCRPPCPGARHDPA